MGVNAAVTIAALPAAYFVIRALLRSALGRRLVAEPSSERWHGSSTPTFGGVGIYSDSSPASRPHYWSE